MVSPTINFPSAHVGFQTSDNSMAVVPSREYEDPQKKIRRLIYVHDQSEGEMML